MTPSVESRVLGALLEELRKSGGLGAAAATGLTSLLLEGDEPPGFRPTTSSILLFPVTCETAESAGYDLPAYLLEPVTIEPGDTKVIRTHWAVKMPPGTECQVRSRSGLAAKHNVSVLNSPGTIEPDYYPNDIKVILRNGGIRPFTVNHGDRIAQAVFSKFIRAEGATHKTTARTGGLGHTGGTTDAD